VSELNNKVEEELDLDGGAGVKLAPIKGPDLRRTVPKDMFGKRPWVFTVKFLFAILLIAIGFTAIAFAQIIGGWGWLLAIPGIFVAGVMYGYLVELQHECLHEHAYNSRRLNRWFGVMSGIFQFSSFSHYKYAHLRHHAFLGTSQNKEFFNYKFRNLDSWWGFFKAMVNLGRFKEVVSCTARSLFGRDIPEVTRPRDMKRIKAEYRLFFFALVAIAAISIVTGQYWLIIAWVAPALLVGEATHFMIELPEHFGLNTQTDPNVLTNTRTIDASVFAQWLTNYNNFHTAHHYHQGVPMVNAKRLDQMSREKFEVVEPSYWTFYRKVIKGQYDSYAEVDERTCMTR
jgi:fatty acid desaturase